jgi:copper resistance protein C
MRRTRRMLAAAIALLALPAVAAAHARLTKSEPSRRATLSRPPVAVRLWFNEAIEPSFARIVVEDGSGAPVGDGKARVAPDDPKSLVLELPPLAAGEYTVTFEVLSVDGHRVKQSYPFTVRAAADGAAARPRAGASPPAR